MNIVLAEKTISTICAQSSGKMLSKLRNSKIDAKWVMEGKELYVKVFADFNEHFSVMFPVSLKLSDEQINVMIQSFANNLFKSMCQNAFTNLQREMNTLLFELRH
ncbi:MAG: hypothetical protein ACRCTW_12025 [Lactococcus garvieae]